MSAFCQDYLLLVAFSNPLCKASRRHKGGDRMQKMIIAISNVPAKELFVRSVVVVVNFTVQVE